jgi:sialic acid synthase SpsE
MLEPVTEFKIENKRISENSPVYFIADIAANHDGDIVRAKELIHMAKEAGADAAKFQHFRAEKIVSDYGFKSLGNQKSHQSIWKKSVFEVFKDASVSSQWTQELKDTCNKVGITFFTSPYDFELVDHIDPYVPAYKIGSGDITWIEMIEYIASKDKPYILATGASSIEDVCRAVSAGLKINSKIALLQCNTNYTGSLDNMHYVQLNVLKLYREMFPRIILGLSDHTPGHATVLGSVALGAKIIEKHFTDDRNRIGPDHQFSMDPNSWSDMVSRTRELEAALGSSEKKIELNEFETVILQRRSIRVKMDLPVGHKIANNDLEFLRPCPKEAFAPYELYKILGCTLKKPIASGDCLEESHFESLNT